MPLIKFKTRSLIRRFGVGAVDMPEGLVKQYVDRGHAVRVKSVQVVDKDGEVKEEIVGDIDSEESLQEEEDTETQDDAQDQEEEEKVEVKIKKSTRKKKT